MTLYVGLNQRCEAPKVNAKLNCELWAIMGYLCRRITYCKCTISVRGADGGEETPEIYGSSKLLLSPPGNLVWSKISNGFANLH